MKIGSTYQTSKSGNVKIIAQGSKYGYSLVEFVNTGTRKEFRDSAIRKGEIRDPYAKNVCGVGCVGEIKTKGKYRRYYMVWHDMINRCYNPNNKRCVAYANVSVCDRWLVFKSFYEDCIYIDGYNEDLFMQGELTLDKDVKQRFSKNKVYSLSTCCWMSKQQNASIQDSQQREFVAISPNGEVFEDYNITRFATQHGLERKHISGVLHQRCKTTKGWQFFYKEIV